MLLLPSSTTAKSTTGAVPRRADRHSGPVAASPSATITSTGSQWELRRARRLEGREAGMPQR